MPLFEFQCKKCNAITEALRPADCVARPAVACARCGSRATIKIISPVSFKIARPAKYSDAFLDKARPFLKSQKETAQFFAEGKGSEDAKTFQLAEKIGERIDGSLARISKGARRKA
jgi:putative FmdB family regulatory protein